MRTTPDVWRTIDLSDLDRPIYETDFLKFLHRPEILRDCRNLVLDGVEIDHDLIDQILLRGMPGLRSISLRSCPTLNGDQIIKLIGYIRRVSAPRPLSLKYISLLGAPLLPLNQPSSYAPVIVAAAGTEILTDLHFLQCCGKDHFDEDLEKRQWHLKNKYPNHPCVECLLPQDVCMKCHVRKTCVGCMSFYCDDCEPYPSKLKTDCHECGRLCERCRRGVMLVCTWCSGGFCSIHAPLKNGDKVHCEWCRNAGRRTRELY